MAVRSFLGDVSAEQAQSLSIAMQSAGPVDRANLRQARTDLGTWRLLMIAVDGTSLRLCDSADPWPGVEHNRWLDAETWPGKMVEEDNERIQFSQARPALKQAVVTPIKAGNVVATNFPVPEVIDMLERFLEQARRGELSAIAIALVRPNRTVAVDWAEGTAPASLMLAASSMLAWRMQRALADEMDGET